MVRRKCKFSKFSTESLKSSCNLSDSSNGKIVYIFSRRGGGKTTLLLDLAECIKDVGWGVVVSPTEEANATWKKHIPSKFLHKELTRDIIEGVISVQKRQSRLYDGKIPPCFLILDDCMFDNSFTRWKETRELFMNGRHWNIFCFITAQYCMDLPPGLRSNADYVFIMKEPIPQNVKRAHDNFCGILGSLKNFKTVLQKLTTNYGALVLDNTTQDGSIESTVKHYRARTDSQRGMFKMGSHVYINM